MIVYIKNMVCPRCISSVKTLAEKAGLQVEKVLLGECHLYDKQIEETKYNLFSLLLEQDGFSILIERERQICEKIKNTLINCLSTEVKLKNSYSIPQILEAELNMSYDYLRKVFVETEGRTIDRYFIALKIEKTKELLRYGEFTIAEIAFLLGYSSAAHLSRQFKQLTGVSPKEFRNNTEKKRQFINNL